MAEANKCIKYSMFVFNLLFWICGCIILGVSIWLRVGKGFKEGIDVSSFESAANLMIAIGCIIMVLGFLGCCGAIRESKCMLLMFFIGLFLILALQITAGVLAVVYKSKIEDSVKKSLEKYIPLSNQTSEFKDNFSKFQEENKCCGLLNGSIDWGAVTDVPTSCKCPKPDASICDANQFYKEACVTKIVDTLKASIAIIAGIAFGLALIQLIGLGCSMSMYCQIKGK